MNLLKKEYWYIWLIFAIFSNGAFIFALGALLDCYKKTHGIQIINIG